MRPSGLSSDVGMLEYITLYSSRYSVVYTLNLVMNFLEYKVKYFLNNWIKIN